ncbi:HAD family hydrolase [Bacteroidota bacterium]
MKINIPGFSNLDIKHIVMDYNGTLAIDGILIHEVKERINLLSESFTIHIVTADTFGQAQEQLKGLRVELVIAPEKSQEIFKMEYIKNLNPAHVVAIGNGRNDRKMLEKAMLGIAVILEEGCAAESLMAADIVCRSIQDALELFKNPKRLIASLRS